MQQGAWSYWYHSNRQYQYDQSTKSSKLFSTSLILLIFCSFCLSVPSFARAANFVYPLKLAGENKNRYLVDQNNKPFMINGEAAWSLIVELNQTQVENYLSDRATKGYNLLMVNLIDHKFASHAPANIFNDQPFIPSGNFAAPQEKYFTYADWVIQRAAANGMVVLLDPAYIGYQCNDDGWCSDLKRMSDNVIYEYGRYVGNRYKDDPNIIWLIGGDEDATAYQVDGKLRQLVTGIKSTGDTHLITTHNSDEQAGLDSWKSSDTWINLNNVYTYGNTYPMAVSQYNRTDFKPFFLLETYYENDSHNKSASALRSQAYWTVLSGGLLGHIFGNCQIWNYSTGYLGECTEDWTQQLSSEGSSSLALVGKLFLSRDFPKLVPDQTVISAKSGNSYVAASRTSDGNSVIIYSPSQMTLTINMAKVSGSTTKAWWFNPASGTTNLIGTFPNTGTHVFTPPFVSDAVLVLDNADINLPAPGTMEYSPPTIVPGDTNNSGHVDIYDYNEFMLDFGTTNPRSNFDKLGIVDIYDYNILISNFGR